MPYCIMRVQKIKSVSQTCAAINHNMRSASPDNADIEISETENIYEAGEEQEQGLSHEQRNKLAEQAIAHYKAELPDKIRKNAVHAVEMVMTFSKEWADSPNYDPEKYLKACDEWAKSKLGEKNLICVAHHFDETTPHTCLIFIPKDEKGKLNCRKFIGGSRAVFSDLQDDFYNTVGKQFELDRGIKGSKAKHQDIKTFYGAVEGQKEYADDIVAQVVEDLPKKGFFEGNTAYRERVRDNLYQELAPVLSRELNKEHEIQHTRELQLTFNDRVEEAKEEIREDYENDVQREAERLTEELNRELTRQRNIADALRKEQEEKEKKQKKEKEDREKAEKEQKEAREKADEARQKDWDKQKKNLEDVIADVQKERDRAQKYAGFFLAQSANWYRKTGLDMAQRGCKNYYEYDKAVKAENKERQAILDKGFNGVGWELTERGTIELFTREMHGRNRATEPFFELRKPENQEWIDALTRGRDVKVREQFYVNILHKDRNTGEVQAIGVFHEESKSLHL